MVSTYHEQAYGTLNIIKHQLIFNPYFDPLTCKNPIKKRDKSTFCGYSGRLLPVLYFKLYNIINVILDIDLPVLNQAIISLLKWQFYPELLQRNFLFNSEMTPCYTLPPW